MEMSRKGFPVPKTHCDFHPSPNIIFAYLDKTLQGFSGSSGEHWRAAEGWNITKQGNAGVGLGLSACLAPFSVSVYLLLQSCCSDFTIPLEITDSPRKQQIFPNGEF